MSYTACLALPVAAEKKRVLKLLGKVLQSITQLSVSNSWYILDQPNYMFRPIEAIIRFVQVDL